MLIGAKEAERTVLSQANEDYSGLYEVTWDLNGRYTEATLGEKSAAAERAVRSLLDRGWIVLYRSNLGWKRYEEIGAASVEEILSNPVSWYPEYGEERKLGERAYMEGTLDDL